MRSYVRWAALGVVLACAPVAWGAQAPAPRDCLPDPRPIDAAGTDPVGRALLRYMRGRLLMSTGQSVLAIEEFRQAAALAPNVHLIWQRLGLAQYDAGNVTEAVKSLDRALEIDPADASTLYFRARVASSQGELALASDLLDRLMKAADAGSPYHILGLYHQARTLHKKADVPGAIAAYESLLQQLAKPQSFFQRYPGLYLVYRSQVKLRETLAQLLLSQGNNDKAIAVLGEALAERPANTDLLGLMGTAYRQKRDFDTARQWAHKVIAVHPDGAVGYQQLAEVYKAEGNPTGVIPDLERYHEQHPANRMLAFQLAAAYESAGRKDDAAALYARLSEGSAKTPGTSVAAALKLAEIHVRDGQPVKALEALGATMSGEIIESAVLVRAARLIDSLANRDQVYREAQRLVPDDETKYGPFVLVGMLAETIKRRDEAITLYEKAIARQPKAAIAYSRKADLLIDAGRYDAALAVYQKAIASGLNLPVFHRKMGMILEHLDRRPEAIAEYRLTRQAAPDDKPTRYLLSAALAREGKLDEAEEELKDLLARSPEEIQAYCQLAGMYLAKKDLAAAEEAIAKARRIDADAVNPKALLAEIRFRQKRIDDTIALAREILADHPDDHQIRLLMAYALSAKHQPAEAVKEVRALLAALPENIGWRYLLAGLYQEMGDSASAERELKRILQDQPDHAQSKNDLGYLWADRGVNLERAEQMIRQALEAQPGSPAYLDSLGWVMYKQGRFADAVRMLEEATRLDPSLDAVLWDHLGDAYWRLDRRDDAVKAWQAAMKILESRGSEAKADDVGRVQRKLETFQAGVTPPIAPRAPKLPGQENPPPP